MKYTTVRLLFHLIRRSRGVIEKLETEDSVLVVAVTFEWIFRIRSFSSNGECFFFILLLYPHVRLKISIINMCVYK